MDLATRVFDRSVINALEHGPKTGLKVRDLSRAAQIRRGITTHLQEMKVRGLVILGSGELGMDTIVQLSHC